VPPLQGLELGTSDAEPSIVLDSTTAHGLIRPRMPVVGSNSVQEHHYYPLIPLTWVTSVDDKVHVDRPGDQAMRAWMTTPPPRA
jgi:hypothetical protein